MSNELLKKLTDKLIDDAERLFGNSIQEWTFAGVEINDRPPSLMYYPESGKITISISEKVIDDNVQLIFQLSHEVCHLLHPSIELPSLRKNPTLVINEGVSTFYSLLKMEELFKNRNDVIESLKTYSANYFEAYIAVRKLIGYDSNAIKKLRKIKPRIDKLNAQDFEEAKLEIDDKLKRKLVEVFV